MLLLKNLDEAKEFLARFRPRISNSIEYEILSNYHKNRILITAEHAITKKVFIPRRGENAYAGIGDKNTDKLALLAAWRIKCAYIIPRIIRTKIDFCRPAKDLGKTRLYARLFYADDMEEKKEPIIIHKEKNSISSLLFFHRLIELLKPNAILSFHGMHPRYKPDILLGFGPNKIYIGGWKNASGFRDLFQSMLKNKLEKLDLNNGMDIKIAKKLFTGTQNYTLFHHVRQFNKKRLGNRIGVHAEFNLRGRVMRKTKELPILKYQIASQVLAESLQEWVKNHI